MITETLQVIDVESSLWPALRPLIDAALRLENNDRDDAWHGWDKHTIETFLQLLPEKCSLVVGVWELLPPVEGEVFGEERLALGCACEVLAGEIQAIYSFEALAEAGLKPVAQLEPGLSDALEIMRAAKKIIAPVAWALFTDRDTWNEWVYDGDERQADKAQQLAAFARQGRCVLLGSQAGHAHHYGSD
ncbi:MAG TPA: hypothetical protein VNE61_17655 [Ktedonobacteraceae bacterium]|nr:hypothetical protein [Ktedonobacteraceae bacterium]